MTIDDQIRAQVLAALQTPEAQAILRQAVVEGLRLAAADKDDQLVGAAVAARELGLARSTVYKLAKSIDLPSVKIGTVLRFRIRDLKAFAESRRRSPELVARLVAGH